MGMWNQESYITAWNYASRVHDGQCMPGSSIAYINHLGLVAMEATAAVASSDAINQPDLLVQCALLHDTIEDTDASYDNILATFGQAVADGVMALSKNPACGDKAAQMADSLQRIQQQPKEIWMVKLCDRITNLQAPPAHWDKAKIARYKQEAICIVETLGDANPYLAKRLRDKIANYVQYE